MKRKLTILIVLILLLLTLPVKVFGYAAECPDYGEYGQYDAASDYCSCQKDYTHKRVDGVWDCINGDDLCEQRYGEHASFYDLTDGCKCDEGYAFGKDQYNRTQCLRLPTPEEIAQEEEKQELKSKYAYFQTRQAIACRTSSSERCLWTKVDLAYADEILEKVDRKIELKTEDIGQLKEKITVLEERLTAQCKEKDKPAPFCIALGKLIERVHYFIDK